MTRWRRADQVLIYVALLSILIATIIVQMGNK